MKENTKALIKREPLALAALPSPDDFTELFRFRFEDDYIFDAQDAKRAIAKAGTVIGGLPTSKTMVEIADRIDITLASRDERTILRHIEALLAGYLNVRTENVSDFVGALLFDVEDEEISDIAIAIAVKQLRRSDSAFPPSAGQIVSAARDIQDRYRMASRCLRRAAAKRAEIEEHISSTRKLLASDHFDEIEASREGSRARAQGQPIEAAPARHADAWRRGWRVQDMVTIGLGAKG